MTNRQGTNYTMEDLLRTPPTKSPRPITDEEALGMANASPEMKGELIEGDEKAPDLTLVKEEERALTPAEQARLAEIEQAIDFRDSQTASLYGTQVQKQMAEFSDAILSEVKNQEAGQVGDMLAQLLVQIKNSSPEEAEPGFFRRLFQKGKNKLDLYLTSYDSLAVTIDEIVAQLQNEQQELMRQITVFDQLYENNLRQYRELNLYILAGENSIQEMREVTLPRLYEEAQNMDNPMAIQVASDLEANVNRFERKVHELKISCTLALQTAPQIRLIQNNDQLLVEKINDVIHNTIPLWRSQTVIALGLYKQENALAMQQAISETTNQLIRDNAQKLKQTSRGVQEEAERSTVDVESLEAANRDLISAITDSVEISRQAKASRKEAEVKMVQIKEDLRQALLQAMGNGKKQSLNSLR